MYKNQKISYNLFAVAPLVTYNMSRMCVGTAGKLLGRGRYEKIDISNSRVCLHSGLADV